MQVKNILFAFVLVFTGTLFAQGNLQFNQVRLIKYSDGTQTVPAGKVWKLESVFPYNDVAAYSVSTSGNNTSVFSACIPGSPYIYYYSTSIAIDGILVPFGRVNGGAVTDLPMWLPAGTTICLANSSAFSAQGYNIIEFNIIP